MRAWGEVNLLAITGGDQQDQQLQQSKRQGFWFQIRSRKKDPLTDCSGAGARLQKMIFEYLQLYDSSIKDRAYLRKALRLQCRLFSLHWSATVRQERRKHHREFRARVQGMVDKEEDKKKNCQIFRDGLTVRGGGSGLCRRLADVGAPRVIQVQHAFALTSVVLLARRRGAKSIYCAYEHESKRTPSVPDPLKSNVTLFEGGEIVKQAFRQDTIEHGDYSTQPQVLEKNACGVVTEHMIGVLVQLHG